MIDHQDILYGIASQSIYLDVPEGRPSAVTSVYVYWWTTGDDTANAETATTGSAAIDSVNTTFDADSGFSQANQHTLNLTATTNVVKDRRYLATNAVGAKEWVEVAGITSAASVTSRVPLANDYAAADTFVGTRISISLLDTWVADSDNISDSTDPNSGWRVRWEYVVDSVTYVRHTFFDVVRVGGEHDVTPADMELFVGNWSGKVPMDHRTDQGRGLIDEGYRMFKMDLLASDIPDQQIRNTEVVNHIVKHAAAVVLHRTRFYEQGGDPGPLEDARKEYDSLIDRMFRVEGKVSIGYDESGAGARSEAPGIWSR